MKKLLIDAISTSSGGAINHLSNILKNFNKQNYFSEVDVYLPHQTKKLMPKIKNINYKSLKILDKHLILRIFWQVIVLNIIAFNKNYQCIFVTGSSHLIIKKPVITISQNLLPFNFFEVRKYFFSIFFFKLLLLRFTQTISIRFSQGVIFLHKYSKKFLIQKIGKIKGESKIIAHGVHGFKQCNFYKKKKYRLIYVSNIDYYKHQMFLLKNIDDFILENPSFKNKIIIEFYGASYKPALEKFQNYLNNKIINKKNFKYYGLKSAKFIYSEKKDYDTIFLFASSCENFAVSLIEGMSKGYPTLCVNLQPMRSVLGKSGIFYKFESGKSFKNCLKKILKSKKLQNEYSKNIFKRAQYFSDKAVAAKTFKFLIKISKKYEK